MGGHSDTSIHVIELTVTLQLPRHWNLPLHFGLQKASMKAGLTQIIMWLQSISSLVPSPW